MNLEDKFFYRLVNVLFYIFLFLFFGSLLFLGYISKPITHINYDQSYAICKSGAIYSFSDMNLSFSNKLTEKDNALIIDQCEKSLLTINHTDGVSKIEKFRQLHPEYNNLTDEQIASIFYQEYYSDMPKDVYMQKLGMKKIQFSSNSKLYEIRLSKITTGSWYNVFFWCVIANISIYFLLNIFRNLLIYLAFGRNATWRYFPFQR